MPFILEDDESNSLNQSKNSSRFVLEEDHPEKKKSEYGRVAQEALGLAKGISDPFVGASQLVMRGLNAVGAVSDEALKTHENYYNNLEKQYQEATPEGSGIGRVVGNIAVPVPIKGISAGEGLLNVGARAAQQGAVMGALQPVDTGNEENFLVQKGKQVAAGAAIGGAIPGVVSLGQKALSPIFQRFVKTQNLPSAQNVQNAQISQGVKDMPGEATQRAQVIMEEKMPGINWEEIPNKIKDQLTKMAENTTQFEAMSPEALVRVAEAKSLPIPIELTKGQATKDFIQSQFERETAKTAPGQAIREQVNKQNAQIFNNFDAFIDQTGGKISSPSELGRGIVDPLVKKAANAKDRINKLYTKARENGDMSEPIDLQSLVIYVNDHAPEAINAPVISTMGQKLQKLGIAVLGEGGELIPTGRQLPLNDVEELRKMINGVVQPGTPNMKFGGELKQGIDQLTEGKGGDLYKLARAERTKYAQEFENQGAISKLLATKPGTTDRAVAYEDVWNKSVLNGSTQDLQNLRRSLQTGGGEQAWKDIRAATVDYIKQASSNNMQIDELGNRVVSPAAVQKAIQSIGDEKLNVLFGKQSADQLRNLQSVIETLKVSPPGSVNTSNTSSAIMNALDRVLSLIPGSLGGNVARGAVGSVKRAANEGSSGAQIEEALNPMKIAGEVLTKKQKAIKSANALNDLRLGRFAAVPSGSTGR